MLVSPGICATAEKVEALGLELAEELGLELTEALGLSLELGEELAL